MRQLPDETLIYDLEQDRAHCLSTIAGLVWSHCDGSTPIVELAQRLSTELQQPVDEAIVWQALTELDEAQLLESDAAKVSRVMSRRAMVATMGVALSVPLVSSLIIPTAAMAATPNTCTHIGSQGCTTSPNSCCSYGTTPTQAICPSAGGTCCFQVGSLPSGFTCTVDADCCAGYCNIASCVSCKPGGATCTRDAECCFTGGNACQNGHCKS